MARFVADVLPELIMLGGAVLVLLAALSLPRRHQGVTAGLTVAITIAAVAGTGWLFRRPTGTTFFGTYAVDEVALWSKVVLLGIAAVCTVLSIAWFRTDARRGEYFPVLLLSTLGAILLAGATDLMELALASLLSSATGFALTAWHRRSRMAAEAGIKYYLLGALANGLMLFGIVLFFGLATTTTFAGLQTGLADAGRWPLGLGFALVVVGLAFKMGAVPAHAWMPDVAQGAPAPVAAFLSVAGKVGALIALARLVSLLPDAGVGWRPLVAVLAAATMTLGNLAALWQDDVRRLLGWSAVSQTGYGLMAVVAIGRSALAIPSLLYFLVAYTLGTLAAFGVVVVLRGLTARAAYAGLARGRPWLAGALVLSFLSFIGIPPLAGFAAKVALFAAAIDANYAWLAVLAVINTVVSLAYYARVLGPAFFEPASPTPATIGRWEGAITITCAVGLVVVGLWAEPLFRQFANARLVP